MGDRVLVHGYVLGVWQHDSAQARERNRAVLDALPNRGWCLTKDRFGITGPDVEGGSYQVDVVHFGWSMKSGIDLVPDYLEGLCDLLRRMYWVEARVYVEYVGTTWEFLWRATIEACAAAAAASPEPTAHWEFSDFGNWPVIWPASARARLQSDYEHEE